MKIVSFFSGCGGLDLGFEQAGFQIVWANEFDKAIAPTYTKNHPNTVFCDKDIRSISSSDIPECVGFIGGPPCQAWSEGGKCLGIEDERGKVFWDYVRMITEKKPMFFVIENVRGILADRHAVAFNGFINALCSADYEITWGLVNTANFQIPQDRWRVFIVGFREDLGKHFVFPNPTSEEKATLRDAIGDIKQDPNYTTWSVTSSNNQQAIKNHDVYHGPYDSKYMARNRVRSWNETSFTIQALAKNAPIHPQAPKMLYVNPNQRIFVPGKEHLYRRLSIRECARIQTFPDDFIFHYSNVIDGYKMVGNAVPPKMAYILATAIKEQLKNQFK